MKNTIKEKEKKIENKINRMQMKVKENNDNSKNLIKILETFK